VHQLAQERYRQRLEDPLAIRRRKRPPASPAESLAATIGHGTTLSM